MIKIVTTLDWQNGTFQQKFVEKLFWSKERPLMFLWINIYEKWNSRKKWWPETFHSYKRLFCSQVSHSEKLMNCMKTVFLTWLFGGLFPEAQVVIAYSSMNSSGPVRLTSDTISRTTLLLPVVIRCGLLGMPRLENKFCKCLFAKSHPRRIVFTLISIFTSLSRFFKRFLKELSFVLCRG